MEQKLYHFVKENFAYDIFWFLNWIFKNFIDSGIFEMCVISLKK